jgi:hypothetical protein
LTTSSSGIWRIKNCFPGEQGFGILGERMRNNSACPWNERLDG